MNAGQTIIRVYPRESAAFYLTVEQMMSNVCARINTLTSRTLQ
jgi:hypothetical protein